MTSTPDGDMEHLLGQYEEDDDLPVYSQKLTSRWKEAVPWVLVGIFGLLSGILLIREFCRYRLPGFDTELPAARKLIEFEKRQMKGSDDHLYVGTPSQETQLKSANSQTIRFHGHRTANSLLGNRSALTPINLAKSILFKLLTIYLREAYSSIISFIALWNRLRQFLYLPYYNQTNFAKEHGESYTMAHAEHCINYLRHSIQCHADLTPMLWHEKRLDNSSHTHMGTLQDQATSALFLDMETTYTCRKWEPIHEWASSRQVKYEERKDLVQGGGKIQVLD
ncbi:hypothetical protein N7532_007166 [Penicillium argentinense]|uniref:Uncharacterized protein n=1 Tax=Penicillium argentinense TaxID=1131581 RepID=A0A9W9FHE0_9EURO|nr:uncharacterized protein N7532_007166 [Penicillium argentinense]KAJ5100165.1 hypothetical protein N7532_007166 [Penicillium argentinense]